jgi:hypothetical protein
MKQAYRHQPTVAKPAKKARQARAAKPKAAARKYSAPIFKTGLAGSVLKYDRPFDPVWPPEKETKE